MSLPPPVLLAPTVSTLGQPLRTALRTLRDAACRAVQLSVTGPERLVPRELDTSARRDLRSTIGRMELVPAGIDCWIPPDHLLRSDTLDRAVEALLNAVELAGALDRCPLATSLPEGIDASALETLVSAAGRCGVTVLQHEVADAPGTFKGVDPACLLSHGRDPVAEVQGCHGARLSDLSQGQRCEPGAAGGRLDVMSYRAALEVSPLDVVVLDLRQLADPIGALGRVQRRWARLSPSADG